MFSFVVCLSFFLFLMLLRPPVSTLTSTLFLYTSLFRSWNALPGLGAAAPRPDFIFHIGHVGSTLVSRLLAEVGDALPLREPMLLRALAQVAERKIGRAHV